MHSNFIRVVLAFAPFTSAAPSIVKRTTAATSTEFDELVRAADLSSAAYTGCTGTAFDVTITLQLDNTTTDTQGFVGYSTEKERISVVMRGSSSIEDFINDADIIQVTPELSGVTFPSGTEVMNGIYSPWASVHDSVIAEVSSLVEQYPTYTLESTGHSLGGALTYLSYIALTQNFPSSNVTSNALAAFAIGNSVFAEFGTAQNGTLRRGNNAGDGVPNLYPLNTHYGTEFYGSGTLSSTVECVGETDTSCSAGDGAYGVTIDHFSDFGVIMYTAGCS